MKETTLNCEKSFLLAKSFCDAFRAHPSETGAGLKEANFKLTCKMLQAV